MTTSRYVIALGSNQRHMHFGAPRTVIGAAIDRLAQSEISLVACSGIVDSRPIGPSRRQYANAAIAVDTPLVPPDVLILLKTIEAEFGPRRGQAWSSRVLDMDIILWSGGTFVEDHPALAIPHVMMRERPFVLGPASEIAGQWRDPLTGLKLIQLWHRLKRFRNHDNKDS
ncbi:2-amino-4-hydroxy-6-hydroxymethyldihydropteridine diphosphokinase [Parasphingorhabdus sp.]|uniref:2-amino-4-hydroxy-6- hydroxymethyldihydropteridine diphosphokinase n=1 Tax=Parasphingorhabdus sp. TaxID=2709688 RepID=UPI0032639BDD